MPELTRIDVSLASRMRAALTLSCTLTIGCAAGEYRLPYEDGTTVTITADFVTHGGPQASMYDMVASPSPGRLVAAADGWVRFIEDGNSTGGSGNNNYVWIEHPSPYCQDPSDRARATWPGKPANYDRTCEPCRRAYCNEWSVYAHMSPGSTTGTGPNEAGLSVGDWVTAGTFLGIEDDIGFTTGVHLHWHVAVIDPDWTPSVNGDYEAFLDEGTRPERIPVVCTAADRRVLWRESAYTAVPCP